MTARDAQFDPMTWMRDAACTGATDAFFADRGRDASKIVAQAKKVCAGCPVREQCLAYALESRQLYGVWGGTTVRERRKMIRQLGMAQAYTPAPPCGEPAGYVRHSRASEPACDECKAAHARYEWDRRHVVA